MAELANKHPDVFTEFSNGHFTVQKTKRMFSAIPLDQAHEQNNAYVKGNGGAIGLTDNATATAGLHNTESYCIGNYLLCPQLLEST